MPNGFDYTGGAQMPSALGGQTGQGAVGAVPSFSPFGLGIGAGIGALGAFGQHSLAGAANPYLQQAGQYYAPYMQAGQAMLPGLESQYGQLTGDPAAMLARFGAGYQQSPGYQAQVSAALRSANQAAAAGGMAGSPAEQQALAGRVSGITAQDYQNYLQNVLGLYGQGLGGMGGLAGMGLQAAGGAADVAKTQAQLAYAEQMRRNQAGGGLFGGIGGFASGLMSIPGVSSALGL